MPDAISPEDRALIDAALSRRKVIPTGVSAYAGDIYDERLGRLVPRTDGLQLSWRAANRRKARRGMDKKVLERRDRIRRLVAAGKDLQEIVAAVDVSEFTVRKDLKAMSLEVHRKAVAPPPSAGNSKAKALPKPKRKALPPAPKKAAAKPQRKPRKAAAPKKEVSPQAQAVAARRAVIAKLHAAGVCVPRMVSETGLKDQVIRQDLRKLDLTAIPVAEDPEYVPRPAVSPAVAARRKRLADLAAKGHGIGELAEILGVSRATVFVDAKAAGIRVPSRGNAKARKVQELRARVRSVFDGKLSIPEMSVKLGAPPQTIRNHLTALGLEAPKARVSDVREAKSREKVCIAYDGVRTAPEIIEVTGLAPKTVYKHLKTIGLVPPTARRGRHAARAGGSQS